MFADIPTSFSSQRSATSSPLNERALSTSLSKKDLGLFIKRAVDAAFDLKLKQLKILMAPQRNSLLSIKEVAELFGVSVVTIHAWKKSGKLKGFKRIGGRVYIQENDCLDCMKEIKLRPNTSTENSKA